MSYTDRTIACADCGAEFVHSAADQQRYAERGFENDPKRCPNCRTSRKAQGGGQRRGGGGGGGGGYGGGGMGRSSGPREMFPATCAGCGKPTQVPFRPTEGRPVYCRDCYDQNRRR